jgi:hypothetical protein
MRFVAGSMMPSRAWMSRISPTTSSRSGPNSMRRSRRHSSDAAASPMRGCWTSFAGTAVRPYFANSLSVSESSEAERCIALAVPSSARLTTNSPGRWPARSARPTRASAARPSSSASARDFPATLRRASVTFPSAVMCG